MAIACKRLMILKWSSIIYLGQQNVVHFQNELQQTLQKNFWAIIIIQGIIIPFFYKVFCQQSEVPYQF